MRTTFGVLVIYCQPQSAFTPPAIPPAEWVAIDGHDGARQPTASTQSAGASSLGSLAGWGSLTFLGRPHCQRADASPAFFRCIRARRLRTEGSISEVQSSREPMGGQRQPRTRICDDECCNCADKHCPWPRVMRSDGAGSLCRASGRRAVDNNATGQFGSLHSGGIGAPCG